MGGCGEEDEFKPVATKKIEAQNRHSWNANRTDGGKEITTIGNMVYEFPTLQQRRIFLILLAMVKTERIKVKTGGNCDVVNITEEVSKAIAQSDINNGTVTVFNVGSTAGITTTEYEPGLANYDIAAAFERIAPQRGRYEHEKTWHDDNGHSHVRAALLGPSLSVPVVDGQMMLGTWQQIILVDFDTRARTRTVICQLIGE